MQITLNGESRELASGTTIAQLLAEMNIKSNAIAVEVNREIVSRERHEATPLNDGDTLEIVTFVGGG
jgi:thiamine biosynthesis protein ThiS